MRRQDGLLLGMLVAILLLGMLLLYLLSPPRKLVVTIPTPTAGIGTASTPPPAHRVLVGRTPVVGYILICRDDNGLDTLTPTLARANVLEEWPPSELCPQ